MDWRFIDTVKMLFVLTAILCFFCLVGVISDGGENKALYASATIISLIGYIICETIDKKE